MKPKTPLKRNPKPKEVEGKVIERDEYKPDGLMKAIKDGKVTLENPYISFHERFEGFIRNQIINSFGLSSDEFWDKSDSHIIPTITIEIIKDID